MLTLTRAEVSRAAGNRVYWAVVAGTLLMLASGVYGVWSMNADAVAAGAESAQSVGRLMASQAFVTGLFAAIIGILVATRDFGSKLINRTVRIAPIESVIMAKGVVASLFGLVTGALGAVATLVYTSMALSSGGHALDLAENTAVFILRHSCHAGLAGMWGVFLGFVLRSAVLAIIVQIGYQVFLEDTVIKSFPSVGRWLPGGAEFGIVQDVSFAQHTSVSIGLATYVAWLALLAVAARAATLARKAR
jgi:hypothetical protein